MTDGIRSLRHDTGYWLLRAMLSSSPVAGLGLWRRLGMGLGRVAWRVIASERRRALAHLEFAFPESEARWRERTARRCARHLGCLLGEVMWLWRADPEDILGHTCFSGLDHLRGALDSAGGAILVTAHCGNWEWMNLALGASGIPMTVAAREVFDPRLDEVITDLRGRFGGTTVVRGEGAGRRLSRALQSQRVIGLLIDQDIDTPGCFVEFFGHPAWTPTGAAILALRTGTPVVTGFAARSPNGDMSIRFDPAIVPEVGDDLETAAATLTALCTARIEAAIRDKPSQWVWMHRRWRRKPDPLQPVWSADGPSHPVTDSTSATPVQS